jgi:hypothetical protein
VALTAPDAAARARLEAAVHQRLDPLVTRHQVV